MTGEPKFKLGTYIYVPTKRALYACKLDTLFLSDDGTYRYVADHFLDKSMTDADVEVEVSCERWFFDVDEAFEKFKSIRDQK
jgi:hypothetical protein